MCRLLGIVRGSDDDVRSALLEFRKLAETGNVPAGDAKGHKDGWGMVAYKGPKPFLVEHGAGSALEDPAYEKAVNAILERKDRTIVLVHLRKASVGPVKPENCHPFVKGQYSFCHNGSVFNSENISLAPAFQKLMKGDTDSERLFLSLVQHTSGVKTAHAARRALTLGVTNIRKYFDFRALNMLFSNGRYVWATRIVNTKNKTVREKKLLDYYSLYHGHNHDGVQIVSSEKMPVPGITWTKLNNNALAELDSKTYKIHTGDI